MSSAAPAASLSVDGLAPPSVVEPRSVEEFAAALAEANARGQAVIPWGSGAHMALGNVPSRYDVALRTTMLDRVIEYELADLVITVESGITLGRLQALLAEHGQFLPIDAPAEATVGGVLAANVSGPSRHAYGLPRDWLIGCRVALADGTLMKGGGRVVKNVAGYDLPKLFVGSIGTLGVIVEATFKLAPLPPAQETLLFECANIEDAARPVREADERSLALRAAAILCDERATTAALWLAGPQSAVHRTREEIDALAGSAERERLAGDASTAWWATTDASPRTGGVALQASVLPSHVPRVLTALKSNGPCETAVAYPTTGLVLARLGGSSDAIVGMIVSLRRTAVETGGALVVAAAPLEVKQRIDVWGDIDALPLMRSLKRQFDPKGTLSPGRFAGGL